LYVSIQFIFKESVCFWIENPGASVQIIPSPHKSDDIGIETQNGLRKVLITPFRSFPSIVCCDQIVAWIKNRAKVVDKRESDLPLVSNFPHLQGAVSIKDEG